MSKAKHVVAVSGGKDSTALALRLAEVNPDVDYEYICTPTGNEPPAVFDHLGRLEQLLGNPVRALCPVYSFEGVNGEPVTSPRVVGYRLVPPAEVRKRDRLQELCEMQGALPNFRGRWCTRQLKIEPTIFYLKERTPCIQYVGLRADEEERGGIYGDIEGVAQSYPLREWGWGVDEVIAYCERRGVKIPWRTDCQWCYHQRVVDWWRRWREDKEEFYRGGEFESDIGHTFRSPGRDTWPLPIVELGAEFEKGRLPRGSRDVMQKTLPNCDMDSMCRVCTL